MQDSGISTTKHQEALTELKVVSDRLQEIHSALVTANHRIKTCSDKLLKNAGGENVDAGIQKILFSKKLKDHVDYLAKRDFITWVKLNFTFTRDNEDVVPTKVIYDAYRMTMESSISQKLMCDALAKSGYPLKTVHTDDFDNSNTLKRTSFRAVIRLRVNDIVMIDALRNRWKINKDTAKTGAYFLHQYEEQAKAEILAMHEAIPDTKPLLKNAPEPKL